MKVSDANKTVHPLISVIIPAYNLGHYLGETIDSVLSTGYPALDIIVVESSDL